MELKGFLEVTIVYDSGGPEVGRHKGSLRADQIASFFDVSARNDALGAQVRIVLTQPDDQVNDDDETGGVIRSQRELYVLESYDWIGHRLSEAREG